MGDITLLELHPHGDIQLGPKSLRSSTSEADEPAAETVDDSGGRSLGALLLVVGVLAVLVLMATKLLGEDADEEIAGFD
ncbi:hypothetical protein [Halohasta litorea]|uniref:Uncharacterized protein n=1 Tax=Halohasta litorea TaxID=869891 RepID=A0ABD6DD71_9EURY|nr:hypothetical protein [Halohasta litorea]MEA1931860.1 hypothetical protein [Euryarchaeota archaeon]